MKKTILLLTTIAALTACTPEEMANIIKATMDGNPLPSVIEFTNAAPQSKTLNLNSPMAWMVQDYGSATFPDWLTISPNNGSGETNVTITITKENTDTDPRPYTLIFTAANGDKLTIKITQNGDIYATFKNDDTPRWESGPTVQKNIETPYTFITDAGKKLDPNTKYKTGRITQKNGSEYEILEFDAATIGPQDAQIRTQSGTTPLHYFEIIKVGAGLNPPLWIVFQETESSPQRRVVM